MATSSNGGQVNSLKSKALSNLRWRKVVLKISGDALTGSDTCNIDPKVCRLNALQKENQLQCSNVWKVWQYYLARLKSFSSRGINVIWKLLWILIHFFAWIPYQVSMLVSSEVAIASSLGVEVSVDMIVLWSLVSCYSFQFCWSLLLLSLWYFRWRLLLEVVISSVEMHG